MTMHRTTTTLLVAMAMTIGCQAGRQEERSEARLSDAAKPAASVPQSEAVPPGGGEAQEQTPPEQAAPMSPRSQAETASRGEAAPSEPSMPQVAARAATPEPTPTPLPPVEVPAGTKLAIKLLTPVSSAKSQAGERITAEVTQDVRVDSRLAIPAGSKLHGRVTAAVGAGRVKGRARLAFELNEVVVRGRPYDISVRSIDITAKSTKKKDAAMVGGGAGLGAVIGAIAGGKKGAAIGAAVGAGAGGGAAVGTKGQEVEMGAGHRLQLRLTESLTLR
jgi:hypothetical protein